MKSIMEKYEWESPLVPMGAKNSGDKRDALLKDKKYIAEEKIDGARYVAIDGRLFSRKLSVKDGMPVEKTKNVPHIMAELSKLPPKTILDGEIYYPGENSSRVSSIMGALPAKAIARQEGNPIRYCVYDILSYNGKNLVKEPWEVRRDYLEKAFDGHLKSSKHIDLSPVCYGDKEAFLNAVLDKGGEGIVLKNVSAPYFPDKKPEHVWYKVKKDYPIDVVIMGVSPANPGKYEGQAGSLIFGQHTVRGGPLKRLGTCSGFDDAMRLDITAHPSKYIGQVMEIHAMEKTKDGFFRHPQFIRLRDDKPEHECIIEE